VQEIQREINKERKPEKAKESERATKLEMMSGGATSWGVLLHVT